MSLAIADSAPRTAKIDRAAAPEWLARGRIPCLDGMRALAVLLVVYAHASHTTGFPDLTGLPSLRLGHLGVEAFLVVSGFLITTLLLREIHRTGQLNVTKFCLARMLKICPPLVCLLGILVLLKLTGVLDLRWRDLLPAATFTTNFIAHPAWPVGHTWTLSIQEHFYLAWPFVLATCSLARSRKLIWACIGGCLLLRCGVVLFWPHLDNLAHRWTFARADGVAIGCLLAFAAYDPVWRERFNRLVHDYRCLLLVAGLLLASRALSVASWRYWVGISFTVNSVCFAVFLWAAVQRSGSLIGRCFNHPAAVALGSASFSLYVWQQLFLQPHQELWWCAFPQNLLFAGLAALLGYQLIERPIVNFKERKRGQARRLESRLERSEVQSATIRVADMSPPRFDLGAEVTAPARVA
jgi:peptidoglycan/LPS O-acetylase OafA/YrhL